MAAPTKIWATANGDHRGAGRGHGPGAVHGRVRWQWTATGGDGWIYPVLVDEARIFVQCGETIHVLDPAGSLVSRITPGLDKMRLAALVADLLIVRSGHGIAALDHMGAVRWQYDDAADLLLAVGIDPADHIYVWTYSRDPAHLRHSRLTCLEPDGKLRWSEPHVFRLNGHRHDAALVCDDEGIVYTVNCACMSGPGGPHLIGGVAAYDFRGCRWARRGGLGYVNTLHGCESGALGREYKFIRFTRDGEIAWVEDDREGPVVAVDGITGGLRTTPHLAELPWRCHQLNEGVSGTVHCAFDTTGRVYLGGLIHGENGRLIAVDMDNDLLWRLDVPSVDSSCTPVIGPDATTLYTGQLTLTAVE